MTAFRCFRAHLHRFSAWIFFHSHLLFQNLHKTRKLFEPQLGTRIAGPGHIHSPVAMHVAHVGALSSLRPCASAWDRKVPNFHLLTLAESNIQATMVYLWRDKTYWRIRLTNKFRSCFTASCQPGVELKAKMASSDTDRHTHCTHHTADTEV